MRKGKLLSFNTGVLQLCHLAPEGAINLQEVTVRDFVTICKLLLFCCGPSLSQAAEVSRVSKGEMQGSPPKEIRATQVKQLHFFRHAAELPNPSLNLCWSQAGSIHNAPELQPSRSASSQHPAEAHGTPWIPCAWRQAKRWNTALV